MVRTGHPLTRGRMTKERLLEVPHVVVESAGTTESATGGLPDEESNGKDVSVESALGEFQYGRIGSGGCMTVCVPKFAAVAPFLQLSDMLRSYRADWRSGPLRTRPSRCWIRLTRWSQ